VRDPVPGRQKAGAARHRGARDDPGDPGDDEDTERGWLT
jgi:hypothetical protein